MAEKAARKILVFGKTGQLGIALTKTLEADQTVFLDRGMADLANPESLNSALIEYLPQARAIVIAAAYTAVDRAEEEAALAHRINAEAVAEIGAAAALHDIPVFHISTDYVFDGSGERPWHEEDPTGPLGVYGASKLAGERALAAATPKHCIMRVSWVYAPWGKNFVLTMNRLAEEKEVLRVVADQIGTPTSALDLAGMLKDLLNHYDREGDDFPFGLYHYTARGQTSWHGLAEHIMSLRAGAGVRTPKAIEPIPTAAYPTPANRPLNSRLDCSKFDEMFGIERPHWRDSLRLVMDQISDSYAPMKNI